MLETLSSILGLSFVSGINLYAAVLTVGLGIRFGWLLGLPQEMQVLANPLVLTLAAAMYLAEFVADKVPFFTPIWDGIHTFIRPLGAAILAMEAAGKLSPTAQILAALAGGSIALGTHSTKAAARLIAHASPDPVAHSAMSIVEDFSVVALLILSYKHPEIAVPLLVALIIGVFILLPVLLRVLRFTLAGIGGRISSWTSESSNTDVPQWAMLDTATGLRCYFRSGGRMRRLKEAYLLKKGHSWTLTEKKLFKPTNESLLVTSTSVAQGLLYDTITLRNGNSEQSFYITKEWAGQCRKMCGEQSFANAVQVTSSLS